MSIKGMCLTREPYGSIIVGGVLVIAGITRLSEDGMTCTIAVHHHSSRVGSSASQCGASGPYQVPLARAVVVQALVVKGKQLTRDGRERIVADVRPG